MQERTVLAKSLPPMPSTFACMKRIGALGPFRLEKVLRNVRPKTTKGWSGVRVVDF